MPRPRTPKDHRKAATAAAQRARQNAPTICQNPESAASPSAADWGTMKRDMLRFLQKRKFRLVTRWKLALKSNIARVPAPHPFPFNLIFRAFDEVLHLLKVEDLEFAAPPSTDSFLAALNGEELPAADHYMELFLSGRDVLGDFIDHDASFAAAFPEHTRQALRAACERVFKHLIDLEMREHARRHHASHVSH
jgi:hypothetical protein